MPKKFFLLTLLIILLLIITPYVFGLLFKNKITNLVNMLNAENNVHIKMLSYQNGWLHSYAKFQVNIRDDKKDTSSLLSSVENPLKEFVVDETITHGPIIIDPTSNVVTLAYGKMSSNFHLPDFLENLLGNNKMKGFLSIHSLITFDNDLKNKMIIFPIHADLLMGTKFNWDGLKAQIDLSFNQNQINKVTTLMTVEPLIVEAKGSNPFINSIQLSGISYQNQSQKQALGLWEGFSDFLLKGLTITKSDNSIFTINNLILSTKYQVEQHFYNIITKISANNIKTGSNAIPEVGPFSIDLNYQHLNAKAFLDFMSYARNKSWSAIKSESVGQTKLLAMLTPTSKINMNVSINTSSGPVIFNGELFIPTDLFPLKSIDEVIPQTNVVMHLQVAASLVDKIIATYSPSQPNQWQQQLDAMVTQGYIKKLENNYITDVTRIGGIIKLNGIVFDPITLMQPAPTSSQTIAAEPVQIQPQVNTSIPTPQPIVPKQ